MSEHSTSIVPLHFPLSIQKHRKLNQLFHRSCSTICTNSCAGFHTGVFAVSKTGGSDWTWAFCMHMFIELYSSLEIFVTIHIQLFLVIAWLFKHSDQCPWDASHWVVPLSPGQWSSIRAMLLSARPRMKPWCPWIPIGEEWSGSAWWLRLEELKRVEHCGNLLHVALQSRSGINDVLGMVFRSSWCLCSSSDRELESRCSSGYSSAEASLGNVLFLLCVGNIAASNRH